MVKIITSNIIAVALSVLFELLEHSPRRFGELKREMPGVSNAVLSNVLRSLEGTGLVTREQFSEMPTRVEYALTLRAARMLPIYYEMLRWEAAYRPESFE